MTTFFPDDFIVSPAIIFSSSGGGGGGTGLTVAETTSAVRSALQSATTLDDLEAIARESDAVTSQILADNAGALFRVVRTWDEDLNTAAITYETLDGSAFTPSGAPTTWTIPGGGSTPAPNQVAIATAAGTGYSIGDRVLVLFSETAVPIGGYNLTTGTALTTAPSTSDLDFGSTSASGSGLLVYYDLSDGAAGYSSRSLTGTLESGVLYTLPGHVEVIQGADVASANNGEALNIQPQSQAEFIGSEIVTAPVESGTVTSFSGPQPAIGGSINITVANLAGATSPPLPNPLPDPYIPTIIDRFSITPPGNRIYISGAGAYDVTANDGAGNLTITSVAGGPRAADGTDLSTLGTPLITRRGKLNPPNQGETHAVLQAQVSEDMITDALKENPDIDDQVGIWIRSWAYSYGPQDLANERLQLDANGIPPERESAGVFFGNEQSILIVPDRAQMVLLEMLTITTNEGSKHMRVSIKYFRGRPDASLDA